MHALIVSSSGEDEVFVSSSREKLEKKALEIVRSEINLDSASWEDFGKMEVEQLFIEALEANEAEAVMELFADISDVRGDMVFMRIVPAELELDS